MKQQKDIDICAIGECMIELSVATVDNNHMKPEQLHFGGDVVNTLVTCSRLGMECALITAIGNDMYKNFLLSSFTHEGLNTEGIVEKDFLNGFYTISNSEEGERNFTYYRTKSAASRFTRKDINESVIKRSRYMLISGIGQAISINMNMAIQRSISIAVRNGTEIIYDPNYRTALIRKKSALINFKSVRNDISYCLPSFPSDNIFKHGLTSPLQFMKYCEKKLDLTSAVKSGPDGAYTSHNGGIYNVRYGAPVNCIDTTGAGDAFNAGFIYGLTRNMSVLDCVKHGVAMGANKVEHRGALGYIPDKDNLKHLLGYTEVSACHENA